MIELKDVTTVKNSADKGLECYSRTIGNAEFLHLPLEEGSLVIQAVLGFLPVESGYITFDGMPLSPQSAPFLRKMLAYIPSPEGFDKVTDLAAQQKKMVEEALGSDADIILAVNPVSYQGNEDAAQLTDALRKQSEKGKIVIVAA